MNTFTFHDVRKSFNIKSAIQNAGSAWNNINKKTMTRVWQKILED